MNLENLRLFDGIVGQAAAKKELSFHLKKHFETKFFPSLMLNGAKGMGKTNLAIEIAKGLVAFEVKVDSKGFPIRKPLRVVNCSAIKNLKSFINSIVIPHLVDKQVTLFLDEASELPHDVSMSLLSIITPNGYSEFTHEEYTCQFSPAQTFIFATSEPHLVNAALKDRLERIDLEDYTPAEMGAIVEKVCKGVSFEEDLIPQIASVLRGNARAARKISEKIKRYLGANTFFSFKNWDDFKNIFSILPLGLSLREKAILEILEGQNAQLSLNNLAARLGLSPKAIQQDYESYLCKLGLMKIAERGREITILGREYLRLTN